MSTLLSVAVGREDARRTGGPRGRGHQCRRMAGTLAPRRPIVSGESAGRGVLVASLRIASSSGSSSTVACRGVQLVAEHGHPGQIYNTGGGTELTNNELTYLLLDVLC